MNDTPPEIAELVRKADGAHGSERFVIGARMFDAARAVVLASLPANLSPDDLKRQLFQSSMASQRRSEWRATFRVFRISRFNICASASLR